MKVNFQSHKTNLIMLESKNILLVDTTKGRLKAINKF